MIRATPIDNKATVFAYRDELIQSFWPERKINPNIFIAEDVFYWL